MSKKLDFLKFKTKKDKNGIVTEVYPDFNMRHHKDIMVRSGKFYAIWNEDKKVWEEDEIAVVDIIDRELDEYVKAHPEYANASVKPMEDAGSGAMDRYRKYVEKQLRDNNPPWLNMSIFFSNQEPKKEDYISKKLCFPLEDVPTPCWDQFMETLYGEEAHKIEFLIGAILTGGAKDLQKFWVFYGAPGTGKSTILNIIYDMCREFTATVTLKDITDGNSQFSLAPFSSNPLVAIDQDADLSNIRDNTKLNMIASHDTLIINEKGKAQYPMRLSAALIAASNSPINITDSYSGIVRRLIDINPTGDTIPKAEYVRLVKQVKFEYGGIAKKCMDVYNEDPNYYELYESSEMRRRTDQVYYFMSDIYSELLEENGAKLNDLYKRYKKYTEDYGFGAPLNKQSFQVQMEGYFNKFYQKYRCEDGTTKNKYFRGFKTKMFENDMRHPVLSNPLVPSWLDLTEQPSIFDQMCGDCPAQYTNKEGNPKKAWANVTQTLNDLDTSKLHFVRVPENHIVIDLDLKNEKGEKDYDRNIRRIIDLGLPATYCEVSKSGNGLHLHYIYSGDVNTLDSVIGGDPNVEIKVFKGKSALRRLLTRCNTLCIANISSGLPIKEDKMVDKNIMTTERGLRTTIKKCLNKEIHPSTKPNVDFIHKVLQDALDQGISFDLSDMKAECIAFACQSSNNSQYCFELIQKTAFKSPDQVDSVQEIMNDKTIPARPIVFYDIEVFPNFFCINWKRFGPGHIINRMINPSADDVETLYTLYDLIGFNNRRYDNHIIYAASMGYNNYELYKLSKRIIGGDKDAFFREAWNLSRTDIYDFASANNKMSLKKLEIKIRLDKKFLSEHPEYNYVKHHELGLSWDEPVPEELWPKVSEYCDDDVYATEASFVYLKADYAARQILADLADGTENTTTNTLTTKFIFGSDKSPQTDFFYRDMSKPVKVLDMDVREFLEMACPEMMAETHGPEHSLLPYFPGYTFENGKSLYKGCLAGEGGYTYVEEGCYGNVALLDVASMHPHSLIAECHFGSQYTNRFRDIVEGRVSIKHKDWDMVNTMLDGKLAPYVERVKNGEMSSKDLANALKTAINSVYGLTSAGFDNPFRDPRNKDNIVAKRGALFMIDLVEAVQRKGYTVVHIKTDSIKIADATPSIIQFVMDFGKRYGYTFEHEATYDRMCIVNKSTYIARYATEEKCKRLYGYVPDDNKDHPFGWTATGEQFKVPYVHKTLFTHKDIEREDLCETFEVKKGSLHLDLNESLPDVSQFEKELSKLEDKYKKGLVSDTSFEPEANRLKEAIEEGHYYKFIGRIGTFTPVRQGFGGGGLYRIDNGKPFNASGAKGYLWIESDNLPNDGFFDYVDYEFYDKLANEAREDIGAHCDFEWFVSDNEYISDMERIVMDIPPETDENYLPF